MTEPPEGIRLRHMTRADVPRVYLLERECFPTPWDISAYYRELTNPSAVYLVAEKDARLLGYGGMWVVEEDAHIVTLAVTAPARKQGIGRVLMEQMLSEARRRGAAQVTLEVRVTNLPAQRLYASMGFRTIAFRPRYYPDTGEDAAVMARDL